VGFVLLGRVTRTARELASAEWLGLLDRACRRLQVRVVPRLLVSDRVAMPCTAGLRRPVILLPQGAESWDRDRREVVLMHELAHVKRRDFVPHLLAQTACAFQWFNPLVWIAAHRMRSDAERACDDLVLSAGARASDYAAHLLEIVRGSGPGRAPAPALPMAQRSEFEGRLLAILESTGERRLPSLRAGLVSAGFLMIAVLPVAAISAAAPPAPDLAAEEEFRQPALSPLGESEGQDHDPDADASRSVRLTDPATALPESDTAPPVQARSDRQESARVLLETLTDANAEVRAAAAEALGALQDTLAVRALMEVLRRDTDAGVRRNAAWALGELEDARAVPALSEALQSDTDVEVRRNAAWALGSIEDSRGTPALVAALRRERESSIRKAIIEALGSIEDASSTEAILPALKDDDPEIRRAAADALSSIEDPKAVDELMAAARDSDPEVRRAVIDALGSIEDRRAAPVIARALSDSDVEVRRAAASAIGSLDELRQVPRELIAALSDSDAEVREHAISSLSSFEDPASVGPLTALLKDQNVEIRRAAVEALENIDDPGATRALREALKDTDPEVRRIAAKALGHRNR
jgi:HEAT repeat protein